MKMLGQGEEQGKAGDSLGTMDPVTWQGWGMGTKVQRISIRSQSLRGLFLGDKDKDMVLREIIRKWCWVKLIGSEVWPSRDKYQHHRNKQQSGLYIGQKN